MEDKDEQTVHSSGVQIFELTMDNPEDQDELNRRLGKPGEPPCAPASNNGSAPQSKSATSVPT